MKTLLSFVLIALLCLIGEVIASFIPLPSAIIALVLLFILLLTKVIKLEWIEPSGNILLSLLPLFFVPAGVSLIKDFNLIKNVWLQVLVITILSTLVVFLVTLYSVKAITYLQNRRKK